ncbi:MAG TPA: TetR/AcrR family transcriptional regulator [Phycisphaerae bacterium]
MISPNRNSRSRRRDRELTARRREEILEVAAQVFARRGYPGTDVQIVADELGVGKGTIYRYFPSKQDLFLAAVDRAMVQLKGAVDAATDAADPLERIAQAVRAFVDHFLTHPEFIELLIQERAEFRDRKKPTYLAHREANVGPWRELLKGLIEAGRVREMSVSGITDVIGDLLYGTMFTQHFSSDRGTAEARVQHILNVIFYGILGEAERGRYRLRCANNGRCRVLERAARRRVKA